MAAGSERAAEAKAKAGARAGEVVLPRVEEMAATAVSAGSQGERARTSMVERRTAAVDRAQVALPRAVREARPVAAAGALRVAAPLSRAVQQGSRAAAAMLAAVR